MLLEQLSRSPVALLQRVSTTMHYSLCVRRRVRARCGDEEYRQQRPKASVPKGNVPKGLKFCNIPKGIEIALTSPQVPGAALTAGAQKPVCYSTWATFLHPNDRRCSSKTVSPPCPVRRRVSPVGGTFRPLIYTVKLHSLSLSSVPPSQGKVWILS